jgi:hypothetical protein
MNLLHTALKVKDGNELKKSIQALALDPPTGANHVSTGIRVSHDMYNNDPYFTIDDYDALDPSSDDDSDNSHASDDISIAHNGDDATFYANDYSDMANSDDLKAIMKGMDVELYLNQHLSRFMDDPDVTEHGTNDQEQVSSHDIHLLSNLLKSMNSSGGLPGPVHTFLAESGVSKGEWFHQLSDSDDNVESDDDASK